MPRSRTSSRSGASAIRAAVLAGVRRAQVAGLASSALAQRLMLRRSLLFSATSGLSVGTSDAACGRQRDGQRLADRHRARAAAGRRSWLMQRPPSPREPSARSPGLPSRVARSIQREPLTPMTREAGCRSCRRACAPGLWQTQLGAPAALALGGGAAALGDLGGDLRAGLAPEVAVARARRRPAARGRRPRRRASPTAPRRWPRRPGGGARGRASGGDQQRAEVDPLAASSSGGRRRRTGPVRGSSGVASAASTASVDVGLGGLAAELHDALLSLPARGRRTLR